METLPTGTMPEDIEDGRRPDDRETDDQPVVDDLGVKERSVGDKEDGIDGEIEKSIEPGPPTFKKGPAKAEGVLDPLIIPTGHGHEAVELEDGEDGRDVPQ